MFRLTQTINKNSKEGKTRIAKKVKRGREDGDIAIVTNAPSEVGRAEDSLGSP
jgi:hypothetical protein